MLEEPGRLHTTITFPSHRCHFQYGWKLWYEKGNSHVSKCLTKFQLVDDITLLSPKQSSIPTHSQGSQRIYIISVSTNLTKHINSIKILPIDFISQSDHRDIIMDGKYPFIDNHIGIILLIITSNILNACIFTNIMMFVQISRNKQCKQDNCILLV